MGEKYKVGQLIGRGTWASVWEGADLKTGSEVAVKMLRKDVLSTGVQRVQKEVAILEHINHPGVVKLLDKFEDDTTVYLVMERMRGGELLRRLLRQFPRGYGEMEASRIIKSVVATVQHLHSCGVLHRDIKPENILFVDNTNLDVKLTDFGLAGVYQGEMLFRTRCGSPNYVAPEMLTNADDDGYTFAVDMWSIGCVTYVLLCGYCPFLGSSEAELFRRITNGSYSFPSPEWDPVSNDAKDFVRRCLEVDPDERLTPDEALEHPWLTRRFPASTELLVAKRLEKTVVNRQASKGQILHAEQEPGEVSLYDDSAFGDGY